MAESIFARVSRLLSATVEDSVDRMEQAGGAPAIREAALSRQVDFEAQAKKLDAVQHQAREEERQLDDGLAALGARKRQMEDALQAYLVSRRQAAHGGDGPSRPDRSAEKKVDAAEQAFDRAMAGAGGVGFARADADTINRVAEIDGMQKSATVAERLAALKAQQAA